MALEKIRLQQTEEKFRVLRLRTQRDLQQEKNGIKKGSDSVAAFITLCPIFEKTNMTVNTNSLVSRYPFTLPLEPDMGGSAEGQSCTTVKSRFGERCGR